jgi:site-specific DNA-methyltransferase (adenine-specific)
MTFSEAMKSSKSNEWPTPQWLFDLLDMEFGFTLDPCCTKESAKCSRYYTMKENGLLQDWSDDSVFMNPPYSEIATWIGKAYDAAQGGATVV